MTYILAEIGSTHDGSLGNALRMVEVFAGLGANAIKFQCHWGQEVAADAPRPPWFTGEGRAEYFARTGFTPEQWAMLRSACHVHRVGFVPSVFAPVAVEMLERLEPDAWKVPSGQVTNEGLMEALRETGRTVYYSRGMGHDVPQGDTPVNWFEMHCTSEYPLRAEHALWRDMVELSNDPPWGLSDHSMGLALSLAAVTLGASAVERHVTLSRHCYGSDAAHSLEPQEFAQLVKEICWLETAMASKIKRVELMATVAMQATRKAFLYGA